LSFLFNVFDNPIKIVLDRGAAFTSTEFQGFLHDRKITHHKIAVASPWANGLVERTNRFLKSSLAKLSDIPENWKVHVEIIQYVMNNTKHSSVKSSPSMLLLGYPQHGHSNHDLRELIGDLLHVENNLAEQRDLARNLAQQANEKIRNYNKTYYDKRHKKPSPYKEGDLVLIQNLQGRPGENRKLKPNYKGPYRVNKILNKNRYVIKDVPGFNISQKPYNAILSSDKLKPWVKPIIPSEIENAHGS